MRVPYKSFFITACAVAATTCSSHASTSPAAAPSTAGAPTTTTSVHAPRPSGTPVPVARESLTTDPKNPVAHDTETIAVVPHAGRLFAITGQWMYSAPGAAGQVLVKDSAAAPWRVFEASQSLRVEAIDSFDIPADQGLGAGHSLLITQTNENGHAEIQWLVDGANAFATRDTYVLSAPGDDVRAFGAHESNGVWSVYAGVAPTGILRGTWSPARHTLMFDPVPELAAAPPGSPGQKTQKVTGFAECADALYVSMNINLYRRNDGTLALGTARWSRVYQAPPVNQFNSGLRGLSCITHDGAPSLIMSTEGNGNVYRFDHLPPAATRPAAVGTFTPILEFQPIPAFRQLLASEGTMVPGTGRGSIDYVIAAYNNVETVSIDGADRQVFGIEHAYLGGCPTTRTCGPTAFNAATFDAAACFAVRTDGAKPTYALHCLGGPTFTLSGTVSKPIRSGQAFVSIRSIVASPFGDAKLYYGGYDANFFPADGTAWIATSAVDAF